MLAAIVAWLLLFYGIIDIVFAIGQSAHRRPLVAAADRRRGHGALGLWAISPDDSTVSTWRTTVLLVFWVGIAQPCAASATSCSRSGLRSAHKQVQQLA